MLLNGWEIEVGNIGDRLGSCGDLGFSIAAFTDSTRSTSPPSAGVYVQSFRSFFSSALLGVYRRPILKSAGPLSSYY
jgi:hypothetical protein